ncbi:hypothetical protein GQ457_09G010430 [Hibiscus cannabinus]
MQSQEVWLGECKTSSHSSSLKLDKDKEDKCVDSKLYRSMIGSLLYLTVSRLDITFNVCFVALSTTEAEYISEGSCCAQVLWMKQQLFYYEIDVGTIPIKCDNTSVIRLTKNLIQHSKTKDIEIRHHFIWDHISKNDIVLEYIDTLQQLADIFTKPLDKERFWTLRKDLGLMDLS